MLKVVRALLAFVVPTIAALGMNQTAEAQDYWTYYKFVVYYDDNNNEIGTMFQTCGGSLITVGGTPSELQARAARKEVTRDFCTPTYQTQTSKPPQTGSITFHWECTADISYDWWCDSGICYPIFTGISNEQCRGVMDTPTPGTCWTPPVGEPSPGPPVIPCS